MEKNNIQLEVSMSARDDGTIEAVYIRLRDGKVARTREIIEDILNADEGESGELLGFEILAPVKISDLQRHLKSPRHRIPFAKFVEEAVPDSFLQSC